MACRICQAAVVDILDLGSTPPANLLKSTRDAEQDEYPLVLQWCDKCGNVQLRDTLTAEELYRDYLYVTPQSSMLNTHYEYLSGFLKQHGYLDENAFVLEVGSNAGYFLEHLKPSVRRILGIDPAAEIAAEATSRGIPTTADFFDQRSAALAVEEHGKPQLIAARHCMAHNDSPHEMVAAAASILDDDGCFVIENAYVLNTIENTEFDQVYHEHMFYYSIRSMKHLLAMHGLRLVDVTMSLVHGGSIIFVAKHDGAGELAETARQYEAREEISLTIPKFEAFAQRTEAIRESLRELIGNLVADGQRIDTYGATAKGNTLLNYVGLTDAEIQRCVDSTPAKQGRFLPKSSIEIVSEETAAADPPDYFLLTAWNYREEIIAKVRNSGNYKSKFIIPIPFVQIV